MLTIFSDVPDLFGPAGMRLDAFGQFLKRLDAYECVWTFAEILHKIEFLGINEKIKLK